MDILLDADRDAVGGPERSEGWADRGGNAKRPHQRALLAQDARRAVPSAAKDDRSAYADPDTLPPE